MMANSKNILLLGPPNKFLMNPFSHPRMSLLYLGTILKQAGHQVDIRNLGSTQELKPIIESKNYDWVGISSTTREYPASIEILNYLKRENVTAPVAIGGSHATALPEECLRNGFDLVIIGEAESCIVEIVESDPPEQGKIIDCGFIEDINTIPYPDRTLLDHQKPWKPFQYIGQPKDNPATSIILSRGCSFRCAFCGPHFRYRRRNSENIKKELIYLKEMGYKFLVVFDDLPFFNKKQVSAFADIIKPLGLEFRCNFRSDLLTEEIAAVLSNSGCRRIQLGVESATQLVLDSIDKRVNIDEHGKAIDICHENNIQVKAMFVWGLPEDSPESGEAIVEWVKKYRPDSIQISSFIPLPKSPLWNKGYGHAVTDYSCLTFFENDLSGRTHSGVGNGKYTAKELSKMKQEILLACAKYTHIDRGVPEKK